MSGASAFVVEAELVLGPETDPAAIGAAVTVELCGHWEHEGACRWPHNNAVDTERDPTRFRTLYIAAQPEAAMVGERIDAALRQGPGWRVLSVSARPPATDELALARRLMAAVA
jgi:hypothetical protein